MEFFRKSFSTAVLKQQNLKNLTALFSTQVDQNVNGDTNELIDKKEVDYYELMDTMVFDRNSAVVDVRNSEEIKQYGSIPGAINIPLSTIKEALQMNSEEFQRKFFISKPEKNNKNFIFFARGPNASITALEIAHRLGFKRSRHYSGGWTDYCKKTGITLTKST